MKTFYFCCCLFCIRFIPTSHYAKCDTVRVPYKIREAKLQRSGVKNYAIGARTISVCSVQCTVCTHCALFILIRSLSGGFFCSLSFDSRESKLFSVISNHRSQPFVPMRHYSVSHPIVFTSLFNFALNSDFT